MQEVNTAENNQKCAENAKERLGPLLWFIAVPTAGGNCRRLAAEMPVFTGGNAAARRRGQKGDKTPNGFLSPS